MRVWLYMSVWDVEGAVNCGARLYAHPVNIHTCHTPHTQAHIHVYSVLLQQYQRRPKLRVIPPDD